MQLSLIVKRVRIVTVALNLVFGFINIELFTRKEVIVVYGCLSASKAWLIHPKKKSALCFKFWLVHLFLQPPLA